MLNEAPGGPGTIGPAKGTPHPDRRVRTRNTTSTVKGSISMALPRNIDPQHLYGVDFGANDALAIHSHDGPVTRPRLARVRGGASTSDKFIRTLPILLETGHVVCESATVGASGVEPSDVVEVLTASQFKLFTVSNRAVKNYKKDNGMEWDKGARYSRDGDPVPINLHEQPNVHHTDAEIIYVIAAKNPERLHEWRLVDDKMHRVHASVRPHDKRNYRGEIPDMFMRRFPPYETLPDPLQRMLGNLYGTENATYSRARAMPLAMAMDEDGGETRTGYEKVLGLYDHGYPSFYRRNTVVLMQNEAKELAGVSRFGEVPPGTRKQAWKETRRNLRHVWHLLSA